MKRKFTKMMAAFALLVGLSIPLGMWGQTRAEEVYSTCLFGSQYNSQSTNNYTSTWTTTNGDFTWTIVNGNNNQNGWSYVKFGRKNNASVGSITTSAGYTQAITKVDLTIDAITSSNINSIILYTSSNGSTWTEAGSFEKSTGTKTVALNTPTADLYYKIEFDCASGSSNGLVTVSKVEYYYNNSGAASPSITASNVNIAYDATNGSISYTINNPANDGVLTASTTATWLTIGTVGTTVPFTCSANENTTERTATVTLTYTYGDNETVSKDVTVTQAAAPVIYDDIEDLFNAATSTATDVTVSFESWFVTGVSTNGKNVYVTDGTNGFVIFDNNGGSGDTYHVNDLIEGTTTASLVLYTGFAELKNVDATNLTMTSYEAPAFADVAMADLSGINTGALLHYDNLTCSVNTSGNTPKYYLSDGTTTLQVYNALFAFDALENGKTYNITGVYQQFNNTKEILPRSANDIEEVVSADPSITVANATVSVDAEGEEGTFTVTYENITEVVAEVWFCDVQGTTAATYDWITADINTQNNVEYLVETNEGEARTAYFKVWAYDDELNEVYSNLVTVSQAQYVADYATLPFAFDGGRADIATTNGLTQEGLDSDYGSSPKLKFNGTGDYVLLKINERPGTLTFDIKGNTFSGGTFTVQTSEDGVTYTDLETYTELGDTQHESFANLGENVRYIKWIYTNKASGNVGLGNIALAKYTVVPSITVADATVNVDAEEHDGTLDLAYENLTITDMEDFDIQYYDAEGEETTEPNWIEVLIAGQDPEIGEGYVVSYSMGENDGAEARSAYFKVYAMDDQTNLVYSNLVTITQAAPEAPVTGDKYVKVTSTTDLTDGQYLIVYEDGGLAFDGSLETLDAVGNTIAVTISNNEIAVTETTTASEFTINTTAGTIKSASGFYIGQTSDANGLASSTETQYANTISFEEGNANIVSNSAYLRYNKASNQTRFRYYKSSSYTGQEAIQLYKKVETTPAGIPLEITGYNEGNGNWYLITSPLNTAVSPSAVTNMIESDGHYDLYSFNQSGDENGKEWINYKPNGTFSLEAGYGYLYARKTTETLYFPGDAYVGDNIQVTLTYDADADIPGLNLVGNPFNSEAAIVESGHDIYAMNEGGTEIALRETNSINPMEGIFVVTTETNGETITIAPVGTASGGDGLDKIAINLSQSSGNVIDRAVVRMGEGRQLPKFQLFKNSTKVYIPQNGKDYAVVRSEAQGELPVNFRAAENGTYTLSIDAENMDMNYLHLIDNMTGADINLLQTPSYTFEANVNDYESRFRLVFASSICGDADGDNDNFAFFSNGSLIVNNEGNATLQVVDLTGRILSSESINGSVSTTLNAPTGVYMLRLINGDNVKVQKIVVR